MKKNILLIIAALLSVFFHTANGQTCEGQQQVEISYGLFSGRFFADQLTQATEDGGGQYENSQGPNLFATYRYFIRVS